MTNKLFLVGFIISRKKLFLGKENIVFLICHMTSHNHVIRGSCNCMISLHLKSPLCQVQWQ